LQLSSEACELGFLNLELLLLNLEPLLLESELLLLDPEGTCPLLDVERVGTGCRATRLVLDGDCMLVAGFSRAKKKTRRSLLLLSRVPHLRRCCCCCLSCSR